MKNTEEKKAPKVQRTVRISAAADNGLEELAKKEGRKVSSLVDVAVEEFLRRHGVEASVSDSYNHLLIGPTDITNVAPVLEAIGKEIALELFLDIVKAQRQS